MPYENTKVELSLKPISVGEEFINWLNNNYSHYEIPQSSLIDFKEKINSILSERLSYLK